MISKSSTHAILAVSLLSQLESGEYAGATQIARQINAPTNYLGKILQRLALEGLLESTKGNKGGFRLSKPASQTSIFDLLDPIEHFHKWNQCFLGAQTCSCKSACPVHLKWTKIRKGYINFLKKTTIEMVAQSKAGL